MNARMEARFYDQSGWDSVTCKACPHSCSIAPSRSGACGVRTNRSGVLYLDGYARVSYREAVYSDDLPLYHFKPGSSWLQVGSRGCTMRCPFCNTSKHSQTAGVMAVPCMPLELVEQAKVGRLRGISFGVNEPAHLTEFVYDTLSAAKQAGLDTHVATSGMWSIDPLRELAPNLDAATIGLKGFDPNFYQSELGGDLPAIRSAIEFLLAVKVHVELTYLVIPGRTDNQRQARDLQQFLLGQNAAPPIILLPYAPSFTWTDNHPPATLDHLRAFRAQFLDYPNQVYEAHPDSSENNTRCEKCGRTLVHRGMARLVITSFPDTGKPKDLCPTCGTAVPYRIE